MDADNMTASPPCLPPISGVLVMPNPEVVRPVAFRPVQQREGSSTPPEGSIPDELSSASSVVNFPDRVYFSGHHSAPLLEQHQRAQQGERLPERCRRTSLHPRRSAPLYRSSVPSLEGIAFNRSHYAGGDPCGVSSERALDSGHSSALPPDEAPRTPPSPTDSGIAELEAQLREKDAEIARLRQTLEQNERAIVRVYEEKEQSWKAEMDDLRRRYEEMVARYGPRTDAIRGPPSSGPPKEIFPEPEEIHASRPATPAEDPDDAQQLWQALQHCRRQLHAALQSFRKERSCWLQEKAQVLQYQRQLELGYWQTCNHNRELLRAVARVSVPVETLDGWYHSESSC